MMMKGGNIPVPLPAFPSLPGDNFYAGLVHLSEYCEQCAATCRGVFHDVLEARAKAIAAPENPTLNEKPPAGVIAGMGSAEVTDADAANDGMKATTKEQPSADNAPNAQSETILDDAATVHRKKRGRPKEYTDPEHKANCERHFQEWRTFYAKWKQDGKKGSARRSFARSKNMAQANSDKMIRYGAPMRKKSRRKSRG
jgi:hypothetical protein